MRSVAIWLSKQCISFNLIEEDLFEWCVYSIEKRIISILTWIFLLTIGFRFLGVVHSIAFIASFLFLRKYTNGYHASTYWRCLILSISVELICLTIAQLLPYIFAVITVCLADSTILIYAPSNNVKVHFSNSEILALKEKIKIYLFLINGIYLILILFQLSISNCIAMALLADAISLLIKNNSNH